MCKGKGKKERKSDVSEWGELNGRGENATEKIPNFAFLVMYSNSSSEVITA